MQCLLQEGQGTERQEKGGKTGRQRRQRVNEN